MFCLHVCLHTMCVGLLGTTVAGSCELPYGCWELNPGHLEKQPVLVTAEPSLQPHPLPGLLSFLKVTAEPVLFTLEFQGYVPVSLVTEAQRVLEPRRSSPAQGGGDLISKPMEKVEHDGSVFRRLRQEDCREFNTCLDSKVNLRSVWT